MNPPTANAGNRNQMVGDRNARHHRSTSKRPRWSAGALLLALFAAHLFFPEPEARLRFSFIYFGIGLGLAAMDWSRVTLLFREEPREPE